MAGFVFPQAKFQAFDSNGDPLVGGKVYFYVAGTSTPANTYADVLLAVLNPNPVVLDGAGRATIFVPDSSVHLFKIIVNTADDVLVYSVDGVSIPDTSPPAAATAVPIGTIAAYGGTSAPTGWPLCNGAAVVRTGIYAALFAVIGVAYGPGDGATTFNLPDLRGKFPLGKSTAGTGATLGSTGGLIDHVHTGAAHTHGVTIASSGDHTHTTGGIVGDGGAVADGGTGSGTQHHHLVASSGAHTHTATSDAASAGDTGTANPPFASVNFIIYAGT